MWTEEKSVTLTFKFPRPQSDQASVDCARIIYLIYDSSISGYKNVSVISSCGGCGCGGGSSNNSICTSSFGGGNKWTIVAAAALIVLLIISVKIIRKRVIVLIVV